MSDAWKKGSTRRWRLLRARVLEANMLQPPLGNGGMCTLNIAGVCTGPATQVHHTLGRSVTGDDPRYLVATCKECNLHVGDPTKNNPRPKKTTQW